MSDPFLGLLIESLVAVLLVLTIGYCLVLNRRLKRLRADESSLRATIAELVSATQIAERAIDGLRTTATDCDATLGERLRLAERVSSELSRNLLHGEEIISRIHRIAMAAKGLERGKPESEITETSKLNRPADAVAVAQAIASRARQRSAA